MAKDPYMPFYVNDWLSSPRVARMTLEQQGAFLRLLCFLWSSGDCSIEDDPQVLATLSGAGEGWFKNGWAVVRDCFTPHPDKSGFLTNQKLLDLWNERQEWRRKSALGGKKSAEKRAAKSAAQKTKVDLKGGSKMVADWLQPNGNISSSSSSSNINSYSPSNNSSALIAGRDTWERFIDDGWDGGEGEKLQEDRTPPVILNLPVPDSLLSPEFVSAWHAWGRYLARRSGDPSGRRLSQDTLVEQYRTLEPFGPFVAALTLRQATRDRWTRLEPDRVQAEWQAWQAETLARIKPRHLADPAALDQWWRENAPLMLRGDAGRLLAIAAACQATRELPGGKGDITPRFKAILAARDPWGQISQEARERAAEKLSGLSTEVAA